MPEAIHVSWRNRANKKPLTVSARPRRGAVLDRLEPRCLFSAAILPTPTPDAGSSDATVVLAVVQSTVTSTSVSWGTAGSAALITAADGLRLLPAGRSTDLPWRGINKISITLSEPVTLSAGDVSVTGLSVANYGPVTISGSGMSYSITLAQPINSADRVTVTIGNANIATYTRRLDVLPGDVNDDGVVNSSDMVLIKNAMSQPYNILDDINGDGVIDLTDYTLVRQLLGKVLP